MNFEKLLLPKRRIVTIIFFSTIVIITVVLGLGMGNLETNNDVTVLLPVNPETVHGREKLERLGKEFPSEQMLFVGIENEAFSIEKIEKLWQLCNEVEKLDVVKSTLNPFNSTYFTRLGKVFSIRRMKMRTYPKTEKHIEDFLKKLKSNRFLTGTVISLDGNSAGLVVYMNTKALMGTEYKNKNLIMRAFEFAYRKSYGKKPIDRTFFCNEIDAVLKKYSDTFTIHMAGVPVYEAKSKTLTERDIFVLIIPALFMMAFVLFMNFRTRRGVFFPLITILLSIVWTMGIMGWAGYKFNFVAILIPPIIMTIGSSYTLHYLNSYYLYSSKYKNPRQLVVESTRLIMPTIVIAAATTFIGFGSFLIAKIEPIKSFGLYIMVSILFTIFFTFFLLSKLLIRTTIPQEIKLEKVKNDMFSKVLNAFRSIVIPLRFIWAGIYIVAIVLSIIVLPKIKVDTNAINFFRDNNAIKQGIIFVENNFNGTAYFNITLRAVGNKRNFFKTREGLSAARKIQNYLESGLKINGHNMIGWMISPVTLVEDLNIVMEGVEAIPDDEKTIKRFFAFLRAAGDDTVKSLINRDFSAITIQVRTHTDNAKQKNIMTEFELRSLIKMISTDMTAIAADDGRFTTEIWGEVLLIAGISKYLAEDQILSLSLTAIIVLLITLLIFRSPYYAFFSLIPLSFGVLMNFSIMSLLSIPLDAATVMIASISIGIGIDDSIHFILHYKKAIKDGMSARDAVIHTLTYTSRPILFTSMALIGGFSVFLISSFKPIMYFGSLIAVSMFNCTFATMFILPSYFIITDKARRFFESLFKRKKA